MQFYMKQKVFSWSDQFSIYDAAGAPVFTVQGEIFTFGKRLHLYDAAGRELFLIRQKVFSFLPRYFIEQGEQTVASVVKEFTFFRQEYTVEGLGWSVEGDFTAHNYVITAGGMHIASVDKRWFTFGDAYEITVAPDINPALVLAVVLVIDACLDNDGAAG